jgi:hypothetical protein
MSELDSQYPRSRYLDDETRLRIRFLNSLRGDIGAVHDAVLQRLQPIPGQPGWSMLDREVSQLLFTRLMGNNPSAQREDLLPVEGMTLVEAREFARRLSWLLARDVRLPDRAQFLAAVLPVDPTYLRRDAWHGASVPEREPRPVATSAPNAHGFHDLLGNVSEWLLPDNPGSPTGLVAGGSVRDNPLALAEVPITERPAGERIRYNGFRVVIDTAGTPPAAAPDAPPADEPGR